MQSGKLMNTGLFGTASRCQRHIDRQFANDRDFKKNIIKLTNLMKALFIALMLLLCQQVYGQTISREYLEGIHINTSKFNAIMVTAKHVRNYISQDRDNIQAVVKEKTGIRLTKKNLPDFLDEVEAFLYKDLEEHDHWNKSKLSSKYGINLSRVLGYELTIPGVSKANTGRVGRGLADLYFENNKISIFVGSINTTKSNKNGIQDLTLDSGFPYNNNTLKNISDVTAENLGVYKTRTGQTYWNSCSERNETVYRHYYDFLEDDLEATLTTEYGILQRKNGTFDCIAIGNQLTTISLTIKRN